MSPSSQTESEVSDYSPLLKAERELFKLRDMMRNAVAVKPSASPPQPKLQKKFYGSERPVGKDDYVPDLGSSRGRKEKGTSSGAGSAGSQKSKSSSNQSKSDKSDKSNRKPSSSKSEQSSKSQDKLASRDDRKERKNEKEDRQREKERREREYSPLRNGHEFNSSTRFDIEINENKKSLTVTPRKSKDESKKYKQQEEGRVSVKDGDPNRKPVQNGAAKGETILAFLEENKAFTASFS